MHENKNLVEEALIQMKNVEEAIAENAKGILQSTMKEEINQLVKESLSEEDDEIETDVDDTETDPDDEMNPEDGDVDLDDVDDDIEFSDTDTGNIQDLRGASDAKLLSVFQKMGEDDGIIIMKDGENINLKDDNTSKEYLIRLGESMEEEGYGEFTEEDDDADVDSVIDALFSNKNEKNYDMDEMNADYMGDGTIYEMGDMYEDEDFTDYDTEFTDEDSDLTGNSDETIYEIEMNDVNEDEDFTDYGTEEFTDEDSYLTGNSDETIYEIEMDDMVAEDDDMNFMEEDENTDFTDDMFAESYNPKKAKRTIKPKGMGIGSGPKFKYGKPNTGGFKEDKKEGTKTMGTGKAKFEYKEGKNTEGKMKMVKKIETKEASRTYGMGSKEGRGLRKGITPNRNLKFEAYEVEIDMLREKNEEYRKALNTFREKLNEVATFNSNLAYATRLFTEHSTTKKEKINILRRFDNVETLKESKNLYKSVKDELMKGESKPMNESVENKLNKNVSTGSSTTLIESKTYENPQFLRIKDLMGKML
jgi:hypothetical protein